jgi:hypothetical protein
MRSVQCPNAPAEERPEGVAVPQLVWYMCEVGLRDISLAQATRRMNGTEDAVDGPVMGEWCNALSWPRASDPA